MHDESAEGNDYFKCDYCRRSWAEDRPMVEGHRGSLICGQCLTVAYAEVVVQNLGSAVAPDAVCRMCLEHREGLHWTSPVQETEHICVRCIKQSAGVLVKDKESGWKKPG